MERGQLRQDNGKFEPGYINIARPCLKGERKLSGGNRKRDFQLHPRKGINFLLDQCGFGQLAEAELCWNLSLATLQGEHTSDLTRCLFSEGPGKPEAEEAQGQPAESAPSAEQREVMGGLQGRGSVLKATISETELR